MLEVRWALLVLRWVCLGDRVHAELEVGRGEVE